MKLRDGGQGIEELFSRAKGDIWLGCPAFCNHCTLIVSWHQISEEFLCVCIWAKLAALVRSFCMHVYGSLIISCAMKGWTTSTGDECCRLVYIVDYNCMHLFDPSMIL